MTHILESGYYWVMSRKEGWYWVKWKDDDRQHFKPFPGYWVEKTAYNPGYWFIDGYAPKIDRIICLSSSPMICPLTAFI